MGVDDAVRALAATAPNFGYLLQHEPALVIHGAGAESYVFSDPNASLIKARQFGEALTATIFLKFGIPDMPSQQFKRLNILKEMRLVDHRVHEWFTAVRLKGNKANHEGYDDASDALLMVRASYDLGGWFHRMVTVAGEAPPFVPPQPRQAPSDELRGLLDMYRAELVEMRLTIDRQTEFAAAEAEARQAANNEILSAIEAQGDLRSLVERMASKVEGLQATLVRQASQAEPINPRVRDEMIERAVTASKPRLTEAEVRRIVDRMLESAGWIVQDRAVLSVHAGLGVAVREMTVGRGRADYLLYVDAKLVGVLEAKREGLSLVEVEQQSRRYAEGLDSALRIAAWRVPLPYRYESTGIETRFTNMLDPISRSRRVFSFHQPVTIARWMREAESDETAPTFRSRLGRLSSHEIRGKLRDAQVEAITGLERSLAQDLPRALIQMATGAGKTYTVVNETYRLLKHAGAKRVLFLVDRNNLGKQAEAEFSRFESPDDGTLFTKLYNVQRLTSPVIADSTHVVICTVQRMFKVLCGQDLGPDDDSADDYQVNEAVEIGYNSAIPPEAFDLVVIDECHRSIYGRWRAVLEYFDAHLVGLTATPVAQTFGFFRENLVSQYTFRQAVADGVNVDYDIMRISTEVGEHGGTIPAKTDVRIVDLHTRRERYEQLETDLDYRADQIGRSVMNPSQLRTAIRAFHDRWPEFFPNRTYVPKTLIFAKNDKHADDIVEITRETFGGDARFCAKITYRADDPDQLLKDFRNDADFRIAVTVDMIATGTDVKPLECVFFLRGVSSATYFEQMKGRGARTMPPEKLKDVTPDAVAKEKFLIVDAVGVTDSPLVDARPLQPASQRQVSLQKLLERVANQGITVDEAAALGARLAALDARVTPTERADLADLAGGRSLLDLASTLEHATDEESQEVALQAGGEAAQRALVLDATRPLAEQPELRRQILEMRRRYDMSYDEVTIDRLISVEARLMEHGGPSNVVEDWRQYVEDRRAEIMPFLLAFQEPDRDPAEVRRQLRRLAETIAAPPRRWTPDIIWQAYCELGEAKGNGSSKGISELINLARYALGMDGELRTFGSRVKERLRNWLAQQEQAGARFTVDQVWWVERIAHAVANRLAVTEEDLDGVPFTERGGMDGFLQEFGDDRAEQLLDELNRNLPA
ncbi:type I restriction-modification enzyme R subunit C-terminal domain-containing protein [Amycolatopsis oliviviridis]|uniref:Type III restriction endonuclease subunit R n=1 Tax=Amycolatopsis oliviviridis TaxID=1471590 RepID=A0ABQ3LJN0_9PSEU|nr:DEAD/DEAH box helicase family protein [Amycolatopsis oliviviridis]GHH18035.1 type III restriction endonuclease subunit R [Amycolatopsis oliviviridis]